MGITVEISYYSLAEDYGSPVKDFLHALGGNEKITMIPGTMSTVMSGEYDEVMRLLTESIRPFMEKYPSVFVMKIANACHL
ncbi:MAG: hypothetical protein AB7V25_01880 [Mangrovibacterium sp.]